MHKFNVVLPTVAICLFAAIAGQPKAFAQGFGDYVLPSNGTKAQNDAGAIRVESVEQAKREGIATASPNTLRQPQTAQPGARQAYVGNMAAQQQQTREVVVTPQTNPAATGASQNVPPQQGGYVEGEIDSAIVPPPANYKPTEAELQQLEEFHARWEEF